MDRRRVSRGARRSVPVIVLVAVLGLLAGGLPALVASPGGTHGSGTAAQAPGSNGSVHSLPWWDPRGWFGNSGTPSSRVVAGTDAAIAYPPNRIPKVKAKPARRVRELASKRTEYSSTYEMSDGKLQAVVSAGPVNYRTASGQWAPIDTRVRRSAEPGFVLQNTTNTFRSYFGSSAGQLIRFGAPGGGWLSVGLRGGRVTAPKASGDTVTFADVAPGVSLSYVVTPASLVEKAVLASPAAGKALSALRFTITAGGGLSAQPRRNGTVAVTRAGVPVLTLPAPFMTDARPDRNSPYGYAWSPKVAQHVTRDAGTGALVMSLTADAGWLAAASRRYPAVVDPTIDVSPTPTDAQNTMIEQDTPSSNFSSSYRLSVGTTSGGGVRSLLKFPLGAIPAGTQIDAADLRLYRDQGFGPGTTTQQVGVYQATAPWTASTATWSNANNNVGTQRGRLPCRRYRYRGHVGVGGMADPVRQRRGRRRVPVQPRHPRRGQLHLGAAGDRGK